MPPLILAGSDPQAGSMAAMAAAAAMARPYIVPLISSAGTAAAALLTAYVAEQLGQGGILMSSTSEIVSSGMPREPGTAFRGMAAANVMDLYMRADSSDSLADFDQQLFQHAFDKVKGAFSPPKGKGVEDFDFKDFKKQTIVPIFRALQMEFGVGADPASRACVAEAAMVASALFDKNYLYCVASAEPQDPRIVARQLEARKGYNVQA